MGFLPKSFRLKRKPQVTEASVNNYSPKSGSVDSSLGNSLTRVSVDSSTNSLEFVTRESTSSSPSRPSAVSVLQGGRDSESSSGRGKSTEIQPAAQVDDDDDKENNNASRIVDHPRVSLMKGKAKETDPGFHYASSPSQGAKSSPTRKLKGVRKSRTTEEDTFRTELGSLRLDDHHAGSCSNSAGLSSLESPVSVLDVHKVTQRQEHVHHRELADAFRIIDVNGDGRISAAELGSVARSLGVDSSDEAIQEMIDEVDIDGDGQIDLDEFVRYNTSLPAGRAAASVAELRAVFHVFDLDKNNFISVEELHRVLHRLGESTTLADCSRMISGVDSDGDGQVNFEEFEKMMTTSY